MKLKICGMKYPDNLAEVARLQPDYLGFIFYEKSPRYMADTLSPEVVQLLPAGIQRVGVFVNASTDYVLTMAARYGLHALQLHGQESPEQCRTLQATGHLIIKVFSMGIQDFDFEKLRLHEPYVNYFLFDSQGKHPGGNGVAFDWNQLQNYPLATPFFLSGGIGPDEATTVKRFTFPRLYALDVNSRYESEPGRKNVASLTELAGHLSA